MIYFFLFKAFLYIDLSHKSNIFPEKAYFPSFLRNTLPSKLPSNISNMLVCFCAEINLFSLPPTSRNHLSEYSRHQTICQNVLDIKPSVRIFQKPSYLSEYSRHKTICQNILDNKPSVRML